MQRAGLQPLIGTAGGGAGLVGQNHGEGIEMRIPALDLVQMRLHQFLRGNASGPEQRDHFREREPVEHKPSCPNRAAWSGSLIANEHHAPGRPDVAEVPA